MTGTGFSEERAKPHDETVAKCARWLETLGYQPVIQDHTGDSPDIKIVDRDGKPAWVDIKVPGDKFSNIAIKHRAFIEYERLTLCGEPVYIVWDHGGGRAPTVHTTHTLVRRLVGGVRRPTGNGSQTDFLVFEFQHGDGQSVVDFFPSLVSKEQAA